MASDSEPEVEVLPRPPAESLRDEIKKHETLYFEDGNIVLMSLPKNHLITAFRVDRVFLSRPSPVFMSMFSLPPPNNVEKYDSVPLVRLQDEAEHLESFLNALYDPSSIPYKKHDPHTISRVEGTLKLCTKYQMDRLRDRIIDHLSADWPNTLLAWDVAEKEMSAKVSGLDETSGPCIADDALPEPCSVIRLARECDIPKLLPAAFYHLHRIPSYIDPETRGSSNGDVYMDYVKSGGRTARFGLLSRDDLMCLHRGSQAIASFLQDLFQMSVLRRCRSNHSEPCEELLGHYSKQLELDILHDRHPLGTLNIPRIESDKPKMICPSCHEAFWRMLQSGRLKLWNHLPQFFGLEVD